MRLRGSSTSEAYRTQNTSNNFCQNTYIFWSCLQKSMLSNTIYNSRSRYVKVRSSGAQTTQAPMKIEYNTDYIHSSSHEQPRQLTRIPQPSIFLQHHHLARHLKQKTAPS